MPRGLFGSFDDDFEANPVVRATGSVMKQVAKGAASQVKKTVQTATGQIKGTTKTGGTTTTQAKTDDDQAVDIQAPQISNVDPVAQAKKALTAPVYFHPTMDKNQKVNMDPNSPGFIPMGRTSDEQEEIQKVRKELYQHRNNYYDQTIGRVSDIEGDQRRKRFQREQEEARKKQEEEQEEMEKKQKKEQEQQQLQMPQGKSSRNRMGKPKPIAVRRAQTKTETGKMTG